MFVLELLNAWSHFTAEAVPQTRVHLPRLRFSRWAPLEYDPRLVLAPRTIRHEHGGQLRFTFTGLAPR